MKFYFIIALLFSLKFSFAQTEKNSNENISISLLVRVFENLNHGSDKFDKYEVLKVKELYSIFGCIYLLHSSEEDVKNIAMARLKGISTQLFNEGKPVILIFGLDSGYRASNRNENLDDDSNIIYVNIGECVVGKSESIAEKVFNEQTNQLIKKKNGG